MPTIDEKAIIQRIRELRQQYAGGRGKSKFARELGLSVSTYAYYEENRLPSVDILVKICELTGVELGWLLTGENPDAGDGSGSRHPVAGQVDAVLRENPEMAEPIAAFVELLCQKKGFEQQPAAPAEQAASEQKHQRIPVLGRTAAGVVHFWDQTLQNKPEQAVTELEDLLRRHLGDRVTSSDGADVTIDLRTKDTLREVTSGKANLVQVKPDQEQSDGVTEFVECDRLRKTLPDCFGLRVDGESMSPRINDGDVVVLSPSIPAVQGQIAVVRLKNQIGVTCKLIRTEQDNVHLIPINERYPTKVVGQDQLLWALAVLCHLKLS